MTESRRSRTRTLPPNDASSKKTGEQPDTATDPDDGPLVIVAHHHGHTPDLHPRGAEDHYMDDSGHAVFGAWEPPGTLPYEYLGDRPDAHPDDHRHDGTAVSNHETGREAHRHAPIGGGRLPAETTDPETEEGQAHDTYDPAEVEASQVRHPSGHDTPAAGNGLPTDPAELTTDQIQQLTPGQRDQLQTFYRQTLGHLDGSSPTPPVPPVREGMSRSGTSIAHPGALSLLNTVHHVEDDALNHEMTWVSILAPLVVEMATYHADNRASGGGGPELAPIELITRARDALEQIRLPRLAALDAAREARP